MPLEQKEYFEMKRELSQIKNTIYYRLGLKLFRLKRKFYKK